jgi:hypothetical protein
MVLACLFKIVLRKRLSRSCLHHRILTAFPGSVVRAARKAAILSVVPVQTTQFLEKPANKVAKMKTILDRSKIKPT